MNKKVLFILYAWTVGMFLAALLLAGCGKVVPVLPTLPVADAPPADLARCPEGVPAPVIPPLPRTVAQLGAYATAAEAARAATEHARAVCASRLQRLNAWILEHP